MKSSKSKSFIQSLHNSTKRNYLERMINDKVHCSNVASLYGKEYWDGERKYGYGGYHYLPGRWRNLAKTLIDEYDLDKNSNVLDIGCGKGYLIKEFKLLIPELKIKGLDISSYAVYNSHEDVKDNLSIYDARKNLNFGNDSFDLVISLGVLHNFKVNEIAKTIKEIERIGKKKYLMVESYRNSQELFNLQCWALTAQTFFDEKEWIWFFKQFNYTGDYEFIFFE